MKSAFSPTTEFLKCQQAQCCAKGQAQCLHRDSRPTLLQAQSKLKNKLCISNIEHQKVNISIFQRRQIEIESSKGYKQNWNPSGQTFKSSSSMLGTPGVQLDLLASAHMAALLHRLCEFPCRSPGYSIHYWHIASGRLRCWLVFIPIASCITLKEDAHRLPTLPQDT